MRIGKYSLLYLPNYNLIEILVAHRTPEEVE
jgi:hypothetical protein